MVDSKSKAPSLARVWRGMAFSPWRWLFAMLLILGVSLWLVVLALPTILERWLNHRLEKLGQFHAHVGSVLIDWEDKSIGLRDVELAPRTRAKRRIVFFRARKVLVRPVWEGYRSRRAIVLDLALFEPVVDVSDRQLPQVLAAFRRSDLIQKFRKARPILLRRSRILRGSIHYRALALDPPTDFYMTHVDLLVRDIANRASLLPPKGSRVEGKGFVFGRSALDIEAQAHLFRRPIACSGGVVLHALQVRRLNPLFERFTRMDFEGGQLDLSAQARCQGEALKLTLRPTLRDLRIFELGKEKGPLRERIREALLGGTLQRVAGLKGREASTRLELLLPFAEPKLDRGKLIRDAIAHLQSKPL